MPVSEAKVGGSSAWISEVIEKVLLKWSVLGSGGEEAVPKEVGSISSTYRPLQLMKSQL